MIPTREELERLREVVSRANSHFRYWKYRRNIGNPFAFRVAFLEWIDRFRFEWKASRPRADRRLG